MKKEKRDRFSVDNSRDAQLYAQVASVRIAVRKAVRIAKTVCSIVRVRRSIRTVASGPGRTMDHGSLRCGNGALLSHQHNKRHRDGVKMASKGAQRRRKINIIITLRLHKGSTKGTQRRHKEGVQRFWGGAQKRHQALMVCDVRVHNGIWDWTASSDPEHRPAGRGYSFERRRETARIAGTKKSPGISPG